MKKQILALFAIVAFGTFIFTSCEETEDPIITLKGGSVVDFNLGEEFVEPGIEVENGKEEDVTTSFSPAYNSDVVNEYIATYTLGVTNAERTVRVKSDLLAGKYSVEDAIDDFGTINYEVTVGQKAGEYNVLRITGFNDFNITVEAVINGTEITIPEQTPSNWTDGESVQGTGTYSGAAKNLVSFTYIINWKDGDDIVTDEGTATYTRLE